VKKIFFPHFFYLLFYGKIPKNGLMGVKKGWGGID
jgi:hypothetical protein